MPVAQELFHDSRSDAEAGGGIFAIGDYQVQPLLGDEVGYAVHGDAPSRRADDIPDKKNAHASSPQKHSDKKMEWSTSPCGARS